MTEPLVAYMAVRRPDAKHRKRDYGRDLEITAQCRVPPKTPTARLWRATSNRNGASSGPSNTSCNVVSNKRVSRESPQRTNSHYNSEELKEK